MARRDDEAILQARKTIELDSNHPFAYFVLGMAFEQKRMYAEAIAAFERLVALEKSPVNMARLAHGYAVGGRRDEAIKILRELTEISNRTYVPAYDLATIYAGLGETNQAFECLERFSRDHSGRAFYLKTDPRLDSLRTDRRFKALLKRMDLPQ
jgi:tetratricopeptide (TPR) repeat protein